MDGEYQARVRQFVDHYAGISAVLQRMPPPYRSAETAGDASIWDDLEPCPFRYDDLWAYRSIPEWEEDA